MERPAQKKRKKKEHPAKEMSIDLFIFNVKK